MAENKTQPTQASVKAFLDAIEDEEQQQCCKAIAKVLQEATGYKPVMWGESIVGYGEVTYTYLTGRSDRTCYAGFSPRKGKTALYVMPRAGAFADLIQRLGKVKVSKSCIYVKKLADINLDVLAEIASQCETEYNAVLAEIAEQIAAKKAK